MANHSPGTRVPAACMLMSVFHMVGNMSSLQTVIGGMIVLTCRKLEFKFYYLLRRGGRKPYGY